MKIQDEDEFAEAVQNGAIDAELERKALEVLQALIAKVESGVLERQVQEVINRTKFTDLRDYVERLS